MPVVNYTLLPEHIRKGMQNYVEHGIKPGSFLTAVIQNDFYLAATKADWINLRALPDIARFMLDQMPDKAWGSRTIMHNYIQVKRKIEIGAEERPQHG